MTLKHLLETGWCRFPFDPVLAKWVAATLPAARAAVSDPQNARWLRCGGTWFAGVNALATDRHGAVKGGPPLAGAVIDFIEQQLVKEAVAWDRAQISVCYPGFPKRGEEESEAAHRYRVRRDSAHVDGLRAEGPERRRYLREHHGFLLGIALSEVRPETSPLVVWEGAHEIMREAFTARLDGLAPEDWGAADLTETYHEARRAAFAECARVAIPARPGEAYLVHRLALHGMAPWKAPDGGVSDGRMIAYFRPETGAPADWLRAP